MKKEDLLMVSVAEQCRELRLNKGISKLKLARMCYVDERTISRLEDDCTCSMPNMCRIISALDGDIKIEDKGE